MFGYSRKRVWAQITAQAWQRSTRSSRGWQALRCTELLTRVGLGTRLFRRERREPGLDDGDLLADLRDGLPRVDAGHRYQLPQQVLPMRQDLVESLAIIQPHISFDDQFNGTRHRTLKTWIIALAPRLSRSAPPCERDVTSTLTGKANARALDLA